MKTNYSLWRKPNAVSLYNLTSLTLRRQDLLTLREKDKSETFIINCKGGEIINGRK